MAMSTRGGSGGGGIRTALSFTSADEAVTKTILSLATPTNSSPPQLFSVFHDYFGLAKLIPVAKKPDLLERGDSVGTDAASTPESPPFQREARHLEGFSDYQLLPPPPPPLREYYTSESTLGAGRGEPFYLGLPITKPCGRSGRITTNGVARSLQQRHKMLIALGRAGQRQVCVFCRNNGEDESVFATHTLRTPDGKIMCPILRAYTCPLCGAQGDDAHTVSYCPRNTKERSNH
uniref:Nanos n=1 Tax=Oscarella lobularis TaxID=121494 RepID=A0A1W5RZ16_OSCLO|nr:nanos [Oscarella lobularis]